jgi:glycosyltransferase 2 family protein
LLTIIMWALIFLLAWCVAAGFGIDVSAGYIFLIIPVVTLVEILPVSVAGLGTREATVIYFFSVVGISSAAAVGFSLGYLLIGTYTAALVGFIVWLRHPLRTKQAGQR